MRAISCLVAVSAAGCSLYYDSSPGTTPIPDASIECPFGETSAPQHCSVSGASCVVATPTNELCACGCTSQGWWSCAAYAGGAATCPQPPWQGQDAGGVDSTGPVKQITCGEVGAGQLGSFPGWQIEAGSDGNGGVLATVQTGAAFAFSFIGTSLTIGVEDGPNIGTYAVSIDGAPPVVIDGEATVATSNSPTLIELAPAETGGHVAQVTCLVATCQVDTFVTACPP
jgi:hypothetical protein